MNDPLRPPGEATTPPISAPAPGSSPGPPRAEPSAGGGPKLYAGLAALLAACVAPVWLAQNVVPVLDTYPWIVCALLGAFVAAGVKQLVATPPAIAKLPIFAQGAIVLAAVLAGPVWGIGLGFVANRLLDRSPEVEQRTTMLSIKRSHKSVDSVYLASWRPNESQVLVPFALGSSLRDIPPSAGTPFYVRVRRGALRFQYVSGARPLDDTSAPTPSTSAPAPAPSP